MPIENYITGNEKIQIKETIEGKKLVLECDDKTEYYCPYCGSYHLRCKDTFIKNIKGIKLGARATILRFKAHKYKCLDCGHYFNGLPQGILKYQQSSELLKREVFHKHCQGISKKNLGLEYGVSDSSIERWFQQGYRRKNKEYGGARCPMVLGIDEHYFSKKGGYATTLVNLSKHKVFDVVLGRSEQDLIGYLSRLKGKDKVRVVVMDLSSNYRSIVKKYFPKAMIVSDHFHVIKLILESFIKTAYSIDTNLKKAVWFRAIIEKEAKRFGELAKAKDRSVP